MLGNIFIPFTLLVVGFVLMHMFFLGEIRYFPIKASIVLEVFSIVLAVALLYANRLVGWRFLILFPVSPLTLLIILVSPHPNALKDLRDLFRDYSGQGKPTFYDQDAEAYAVLGSSSKINNFNSTILHVDQNNKLYAHTLLAQWAQFMKPPRDPIGKEVRACHRLIYHNLVYGTFSDEEQKALVLKVQECAVLAGKVGSSYYIITDKQSLGMVRSLIGEGVEYVSL